MKLRTFFSLILLVVLSTASMADSGKVVDITILFSSDLHGSVLAYDYFNDRAYSSGGFARYATLVAAERAKGGHVLVLDGGDTIQGNPLMYFHTWYAGSEINPLINAMNIAGVDAMTVGNHEFNFGPENLRQAESEAEFPFLSANIIVARTGEPAFTPYRIFTFDDVKVGVLGLTTPAIPNWELPDFIEGLEFEDPVSAAQRYVPYLRKQQGCDAVIVVLHAGFEKGTGDDDSSQGTPGENRAYALATEVDGVDLLLTGHTHRLFAPNAIGNTFGVGAQAYARSAMRLHMQVMQNPDGNTEVNLSGEVVELPAEMAEMAEITTAVAEVHAATRNFLNKEIAVSDRALEAAADRLHDTLVMDLIQTAQLKATGAEVSLASLLPGGGFTQPAGPLTVRDMFRLYPYENRLIAIRVTGKKLKDALEWSARYYNGATMSDSGSLKISLNPEVRRYNVDFAEGVRYRIDPTAPEGDRIRDLEYRGKPLDPDTTMVLALNSYRFSGGGGYDMFKDCPTVFASKKGIREFLIDYLADHGMKDVSRSDNWWIAPDLEAVETEDVRNH